MANHRFRKTRSWPWYGPAAATFSIGLALLPVAAYLGSRNTAQTATLPSLLPNAANDVKSEVLDRSGLSNYGTLAGLFGEPVLQAAAARPDVKKLIQQPVPAPAPDPLADYLFTGTVTVDGKTLALLEHRKTKDGVYVAIGDDFLGFTVAGIGVDGVTLNAGVESRRLALNDDFRLTPITGDARTNASTIHVVDGIATDYKLVFTKWITGGEVLVKLGGDNEQLKNDVFEGNMTLDEYNQRAGHDWHTTWGSIRLIDGAADSFVLSTKLRPFRTTQ